MIPSNTLPSRHRGFTLLEMLVAIAIFASLSMGAYQVLQGVLTSDEVAKRKEARLNELQLAFTLLERDITQMVPRSGRIEGETTRCCWRLPASASRAMTGAWPLCAAAGSTRTACCPAPICNGSAGVSRIRSWSA